MKISTIIKSASLVAILGFGTAVTTSAADLFPTIQTTHTTTSIGAALVNTMGDSLLVAVSSNPSLASLLICLAAASYQTAVDELDPDAYKAELEACLS